MEKALLVIVLIVAMIAGKRAFVPKASVADTVVNQWRTLVGKYAAFYPKIPQRRILAMICVESEGDPNAIGDESLEDKSTGLLQVRAPALKDFNAAFKRSYTESELLVPWINVEVGYGYLELRRRRWNDLDKATRAYNAGDGRVDIAKAFGYLERVKAYEKLLTERHPNV